MSNERRDEIEYASRVERAHRPLRQAREQFANELGDRRSLKIIRVVRPLTRSLRNCGIVVRNISTNVPTKFFLARIENLDAPFKRQNIGTVPTSGRSDQSFRSLATPPPEKQTFLPRKIPKFFDIFSPLPLMPQTVHEG